MGLFFDDNGRPPIDRDPQFNAWGGGIPRLWFSEQRRAIPDNDEDLFGLASLSTFYTVTVSDTITTTDSVAFGPSLFAHPFGEILALSDGVECIAAFVSNVLDPIEPPVDAPMGITPYGAGIVKNPVSTPA